MKKSSFFNLWLYKKKFDLQKSLLYLCFICNSYNEQGNIQSD